MRRQRPWKWRFACGRLLGCLDECKERGFPRGDVSKVYRMVRGGSLQTDVGSSCSGVQRLFEKLDLLGRHLRGRPFEEMAGFQADVSGLCR